MISSAYMKKKIEQSVHINYVSRSVPISNSSGKGLRLNFDYCPRGIGAQKYEFFFVP